MFSTRALLLLALASSSPPCAFSKRRAVLKLREENFERAVAETPRMMVMFYAPWCGHCRRLAPEYRRAAEAMRAGGWRTVLAKVDATAAKNLSERMEVRDYPTFFYFKDNTGQRYEAGRTADEIQEWLTRRERGPVMEIKEEELQRILDHSDGRTLVLVARTRRKLKSTRAFYSAAEELDAFPRARFVSYVIWLPSSAKGQTSLTLLRPGFIAPDPMEIPFTEKGTWDDRSIFWWAKEHMFPTVAAGFSFSDLKYEMPQGGFELGFKGVLVVLVEEEENDFDEGAERAGVARGTDAERARALLLPLARREATFKFAVGPLDEANRQHLSDELGVEAAGVIAIALFEEKKYALREAVLEPGTVAEFLQQVKAGQAKRLFKTEPPPAEELDEHFVTSIVGSTFEKHVLDPSKDVLVYFYAPWAEHCGRFDPHYNQLGDTASRLGWLERGVVIAKMNASKNECADVQSQWDLYGFPKISLFPAVNKSKKWKLKTVFTGRREFSPLANFILDNAMNLEDVGMETIEGAVRKPDTLIQREKDKRKATRKREDL